MYQIIPLTPVPNQNFNISVSVNDVNINLSITLRYNEIAKYWVMGIIDADTGENLIDSLPLVTGDYPSANLLEQYSYLGIGSMAMIPISNVVSGNPDDTNLGTDFVLVWGDNIV